MANINFSGFTINIAKSHKRKITKPTRISRLCRARVILDENGKFVAEINLHNEENYPAHLIIPFTENSYNLKGKIYVFTIHKTERNNYTCYVRDKLEASINPGLSIQYSPFKPNMVVGGYIVCIDGKKYFDYIQLVSFNYNYNDYMTLAVDESTNIFLKR